MCPQRRTDCNGRGRTGADKEKAGSPHSCWTPGRFRPSTDRLLVVVAPTEWSARDRVAMRFAGHSTRAMPPKVPPRHAAWSRSSMSAWIHSPTRSEEHTSELQSLMRISYAVFCLQKTKQHTN